MRLKRKACALFTLSAMMSAQCLAQPVALVEASSDTTKLHSSDAKITMKVQDYQGNILGSHVTDFSTLGTTETLPIQSVQINADNPVSITSGGTFGFNVDVDNFVKAQYQIIKSDTVPTLPEMDSPNWLDATQANVEPNTFEAYPDLINVPGQISTGHYNYQSGSASRETTFSNPVTGKMVIQKAAIDNYNRYSDTQNSNAFFSKSSVATGRNKAVKYWGYLAPTVSGEYYLGTYSDDGAYGYVIVDDEKQVFVEDWSLNPAFTRSGVNGKKTAVTLEAGKVYPVYMEWYEGRPGEKAFIPQYAPVNRPNKWRDIPSNWYYATSNDTPVVDNVGYFESYVTDYEFSLPTKNGDYYVALQVEHENETEGGTITNCGCDCNFNCLDEECLEERRNFSMYSMPNDCLLECTELECVNSSAPISSTPPGYFTPSAQVGSTGISSKDIALIDDDDDDENCPYCGCSDDCDAEKCNYDPCDDACDQCISEDVCEAGLCTCDEDCGCEDCDEEGVENALQTFIGAQIWSPSAGEEFELTNAYVNGALEVRMDKPGSEIEIDNLYVDGSMRIFLGAKDTDVEIDNLCINGELVITSLNGHPEKEIEIENLCIHEKGYLSIGTQANPFNQASFEADNVCVSGKGQNGANVVIERIKAQSSVEIENLYTTNYVSDSKNGKYVTIDNFEKIAPNTCVGHPGSTNGCRAIYTEQVCTSCTICYQGITTTKPTQKEKVVTQFMYGPIHIDYTPRVISGGATNNFVIPEGLSSLDYSVSFDKDVTNGKFILDLSGLVNAETMAATNPQKFLDLAIPNAIVTIKENNVTADSLKVGQTKGAYQVVQEGNTIVINCGQNLVADTPYHITITLPTSLQPNVAYGPANNSASYLYMLDKDTMIDFGFTVTANPIIYGEGGKPIITDLQLIVQEDQEIKLLEIPQIH